MSRHSKPLLVTVAMDIVTAIGLVLLAAEGIKKGAKTLRRELRPERRTVVQR